MSLVVNMACAFRDNAISRALFDRNHVVVEQSIFAEVNGVACKCRPDFMTADGLVMMSNHQRCQPESFGKSAERLAITSRPLLPPRHPVGNRNHARLYLRMC